MNITRQQYLEASIIVDQYKMQEARKLAIQHNIDRLSYINDEEVRKQIPKGCITQSNEIVTISE